MATDEEIEKAIGCKPGSIGPVKLPVPVIVDRSAAHLADFVCGANKDDYHLTGVNWERDAEISRVEDLRNVVEGDASPDGNGTLEIRRGIEVGHIFKLGNKYSKAMNASVLDEHGKTSIMEMGCYGIGVSRIVAASIEQNHDEKGIIWPDAIAPFEVAIVTPEWPQISGGGRGWRQTVQTASPGWLRCSAGRPERTPGCEIRRYGADWHPPPPLRGLRTRPERRNLEYKGRRDEEKQDISVDEALSFLVKASPKGGL